MKIDLNCDMGEGIGNDAAIMPFISSANIACGYHAGSKEEMGKTIQLALQYHVSIGAHPSFPGKENFGRTEMKFSASEILDIVLSQLEIISHMAASCGTKLHHVKPHGALYNLSARDSSTAEAIASAVKQFDPGLIIYGLSGSHSIHQAKMAGLKTASEVFADRSYQEDGALTSRSQPGALIEDTEAAVTRSLQMIKEKRVTTVTGKTISILAETICIHGDGKMAETFVRQIHEAIVGEGIRIQPFGV